MNPQHVHRAVLGVTAGGVVVPVLMILRSERQASEPQIGFGSIDYDFKTGKVDWIASHHLGVIRTHPGNTLLRLPAVQVHTSQWLDLWVETVDAQGLCVITADSYVDSRSMGPA